MRLALPVLALLAASPALADEVLTGPAAFGDWRSDAPGVQRLIRPDALPAPSRATAASARVVPRPGEMTPKAPDGFTVAPYAERLPGARTLRFAPNGDLFVAQTSEHRITVIRPSADGATPAQTRTFISGLEAPFGLAFWPPGPNPKYLYVSSTTDVVRIPYASGDLAASARPETLIADLPDGGHSTRDLVFSRDGSRMFISVGSGTNAAEGIAPPPGGIERFAATHALGALWSYEKDRADVLSFDPTGRDKKVFATGLRNCVGMTLQPGTDRLWCVVNERDMMGDDLPPDYATAVTEGAFYGWPWFYIGANADPRPGARPDLADKVTVPDVLLQAHSAALGVAFYEGAAFPADYRGDAFVALHGSWNRAKRTGYKIVRLRFRDGRPTGVYEDFVTGFVLDDSRVFGRPVSVTATPDGALLFSEDGNGTIWRVAAKK